MTSDVAVKTGAKPDRDGKGRFAVGNRANPHGRPPAEFSVTELLRAKVAERPKVILRLLDLAESEDENVALKAILGIANRIDGMPHQRIEAETKFTHDVTLSWADGT